MKSKGEIHRMKALFEFIEKCKSAYHTVDAVKSILSGAGFTELTEGDYDKYSDGGKHFVIRNDSSIIAFSGRLSDAGFIITASHSDFPTFRVKSSEKTADGYTRLRVEGYGGMINYTWLDRPLSIAGRAVVSEDGRLKVRLFDIDRDLVTIPSVAIHFNRGVNDSAKFNHATDMLPLYAIGDSGNIKSEIASTLSVDEESVVSYEAFLYNRMKPTSILRDGALVLSPRLDDLASVYAATEAIVKSQCEKGVSVLSVFDNEEVGSSTSGGAASDFLYDTLLHIAGDKKTYRRAIRESLIVSCDNSHARHPNHPEMSDSVAYPLLGGGVAIKYNSNRRYATDAISAAIFKTAAARIGEPLQEFFNRADMPGGSTLGSIATTRVPALCIDIGVPQLAMHSSTECCAVADIMSLEKILVELYSSYIVKGKNEFELKK